MQYRREIHTINVNERVTEKKSYKMRTLIIVVVLTACLLHHCGEFFDSNFERSSRNVRITKQNKRKRKSKKRKGEGDRETDRNEMKTLSQRFAR